LPLLVLPLLATAVAAPVPKEKTALKMKRLYGELADAKKGYDFTLDGDKLVLTMGANASETLVEKNPPRIEQEVKGDFEVRVVMSLAPPPAKGEKEAVGFVTAGLCVWADDGRCLSFGPAIEAKPGGAVCGNFHRDLTSPRQKEWGLSFDRDVLRREFTGHHYRIARSGKNFTLDDSDDGTKWQPALIYKLALPDNVRVGLVGFNLTDGECRATFSDFSLTTPKGEKK